jgi:uncharacterized protein YkwD
MMKSLLIAFVCLVAFTPPNAHAAGYVSPLAAYSAEWNDPRYKVCNTAEKATYMTPDERKMIYILNLARMNPRLFCKSVVSAAGRISEFIDTNSSQYYGTLVTTLNNMEPLPILAPDELCVVSARCHAQSAGKLGYVGHDRKNATCRKNKHFMGECCSYGSSDPLEIILILLDDNGVESLGHRTICLGAYEKIGVAIEPHKSYTHNAVLDFY